MGLSRTPVVLTWREVAIGADVGVARRIRSMANGRQERFDPSRGDPWGRDINGACGEMAVAKFLGVYWGGHVDTFRDADVGARIQVRWTSRDDGDLFVKPQDDPAHTFVLVTGFPPNLVIRGAFRGADAKQDDRWDASLPEPAFKVPQTELAPL
jgi:hypothetical protein